MEVLLDENKILKQHYTELSDRLKRIETTQLSNNAIISSKPEEPWESYNSTRQCIHDVIATEIQDKFPDKESALVEARTFDISYCTRVGRQ